MTKGNELRNEKIINRRKYSKMSYTKIANELNITRGTVAGVINRWEHEQEYPDMAKKERTAKREALIKRAQELRDKGFTLKEISKSLNIGSEEYGHIQVHRMLKKAKVAT